MSNRLVSVLIAAIVLSPTSAIAKATPVGSGGAQSESGNPINDQGSSYHYRTYITAITPRTSGLSVEVLEFADRLLLRDHSGQTITVYGYSGEPYARVKADGTTEENVRSPAVYLNTSFYANVSVPSSASATAQPKWVVLDRTGQLEWHDHRIHWMSPIRPPQVTDGGKRTKIFDWNVPIAVGARKGKIEGQLYWVPQSSKAPVGAIVALVAIVLLGALIVVVVRRRRAGSAPPGGGTGRQTGGASRRKEAW